MRKSVWYACNNGPVFSRMGESLWSRSSTSSASHRGF